MHKITWVSNKLVYIIRHGETDYNKLGIVQGSGADIELNNRGKEQAEAFYNCYKNVTFNVVYTSALIRTQQTVLPFINAGIKHKIIPELNEISWGILEGKIQTKANKVLYWQVVNEWNAGNYHAKLTNGESAIELSERLKIAESKIFTNNLPQNTLICMHGRAMKAFFCNLLHMPLLAMDTFEHSNTCLYILEKTEDNLFKIVVRNNIQHLSNYFT